MGWGATSSKASDHLRRRMVARKRAEGPKGSKAAGFTDEERAAVRERARELRSRSRPGKGDPEQDVLAKIAEMSPHDRALAERLHAIIKNAAPSLRAKTWYGMPAYAKDDEIVCFFQNAGKFKTRYATLGFSDSAMLDDGRMWPTTFALTDLSAAEEARIVALLQKALS